MKKTQHGEDMLSTLLWSFNYWAFVTKLLHLNYDYYYYKSWEGKLGMGS